jgi:hypothetical protein
METGKEKQIRGYPERVTGCKLAVKYSTCAATVVGRRGLKEGRVAVRWLMAMDHPSSEVQIKRRYKQSEDRGVGDRDCKRDGL